MERLAVAAPSPEKVQDETRQTSPSRDRAEKSQAYNYQNRRRSPVSNNSLLHQQYDEMRRFSIDSSPPPHRKPSSPSYQSLSSNTVYDKNSVAEQRASAAVAFWTGLQQAAAAAAASGYAGRQLQHFGKFLFIYF